ncbi:MAG TPA: hypothetical protein VF525_14115 [Pyrinomonadaceae bacterium]|jgi:hypothetical protein
MQQLAGNLTLARRTRTYVRATPFAIACLGFCLVAALLIGWQPLQLSIATVFLFAGPHNLVEFRYFLTRMPARWGRSKLFYMTALGGVLLLTTAYVLLYALGQSWYLNETAWTVSIALWNTLLLLWLATLVYLRGRQTRGRRDWSWAFAVALLLCAGAWAAPVWCSLALVYLHPLVALWFLDRQLKRTRPQWRKAYHLCLAALPLMLALLWLQLAHTPDLPASGDALAWRIAQHAGAGLLPGVSTHLLVATHVFLETLHYGVWLVLMPVVSLGAGGWRADKIPLATRGAGLARIVRAALVLGIFAVLALWAGFTIDYTTTRDIYFTCAMAHVLAEAPFLIRLL